MKPARLCLLLLVVLLGLLGSWCAFERVVSDSATRLAFQLRDESWLLKLSGKSTRTFEHRPAAWPDGPAGDYRIELNPGVLATALSYDGPTRSHTTYHRNYVEVFRDFKAAHRKGEPTIVTLELRDGTVQVTGLR